MKLTLGSRYSVWLYTGFGFISYQAFPALSGRGSPASLEYGTAGKEIGSFERWRPMSDTVCRMAKTHVYC